MNTREAAEAFTETFSKKAIDGTESFLSDDFQFSGPQWTGLLREMHQAFPDIDFHLRILDVNEDVVTSSNQITGTHTADFDLTAMGLGVIPATDKPVSNPVENSKTTFKDGKATSLHVDAGKDGGLIGILKQIGVQPPQ